MQAPVDSQCAHHPGTPATVVCGRCGTFVCGACTSPQGEPLRCQACATPYIPRGSRSARFLANLIDTAVVTVPFVACLLLFVVFIAAHDHKEPSDVAVGLVVLACFGAVAVGLGLQVVMQVRFGQSVGKRLLKLKVVRSDGAPVELWRIIVLRNLALQAAAQLCGLVGIIDGLMIFSDEMRCLHDLIADTVVVDVSGRDA
ncbi:MAG: RDD family protein [Myxococcus sp.]|nr:RDD family protein [Myxococcus sp.]